MIATVPDKYTLKVATPTSITSEQQYDEYAETLLKLDSKGHLNDRERSYAKILLAFIEEWDEKHHPIRDASPTEVLNALLEANNLRQKDLASLLGSESIVSEILSGKRQLNKNHIEKLSKRFSISPAVFFAGGTTRSAPRNSAPKSAAHQVRYARSKGR